MSALLLFMALLVGPSSIHFDKPQFVCRYLVFGIQEYKRLWSEELINKSSFVTLSLTKSEFVTDAPSNVGIDRLSSSEGLYAYSNSVTADLKAHARWICNGFVGRDEDAAFCLRKSTTPPLLTKFCGFASYLVQAACGHQYRIDPWEDVYGRSAPGVNQNETQRCSYIAAVVNEYERARRCYGIDRNPWSLCGGEFISADAQLIRHNSSLFLQSRDGLIRLSRRAAHLCQLIVHYPRLTKIYARLDAGDYEERKSEERLSPMRKPHIEKRFAGAPLAAGWFLLFMALGIWIAWHAHERESVGLGIVAFLAFSAAIPGSFMLLLRLNGLL